MGIYTDKQNILIAKEVYEEYDVNDEVYIDDKNDFSTVIFTIPTMDELKNLNPVGYNFIKNLENHNNDLTDYISEEKP
jgi:hypothetical protein